MIVVVLVFQCFFHVRMCVCVSGFFFVSLLLYNFSSRFDCSRLFLQFVVCSILFPVNFWFILHEYICKPLFTVLLWRGIAACCLYCLVYRIELLRTVDIYTQNIFHEIVSLLVPIQAYVERYRERNTQCISTHGSHNTQSDRERETFD